MLFGFVFFYLFGLGLIFYCICVFFFFVLNCLKEVTVTLVTKIVPISNTAISKSVKQISQALNADVFNVICPSDIDESHVHESGFKIKSVESLNESLKGALRVFDAVVVEVNISLTYIILSF